jgi:hypothetical protein
LREKKIGGKEKPFGAQASGMSEKKGEEKEKEGEKPLYRPT